MLPLLSLELGCSVCRYDFTHPSSPKNDSEIMTDMSGCYTVATKGVNVPTASDEQTNAAAHDWMGCMKDRGYVVVKR